MPIPPRFTDDEIAQIGRSLLNRSLPKREWTHRAHFAAALWLLARDGLQATLAAMPEIIRTYNEATGVANTDTGGYHATITLASVMAAHDLLSRHRGKALASVCAALFDSPLGDKDWLLAYWSRAVLFSVPARRGWVAPDLAALPFLPAGEPY